jgi:hypothetical protein
MDLQLFNSNDLFKGAHTIVSVAFLIIAISLIIRSARGLTKKYPYTRVDKLLSYGFIITLYLQLIFGLMLFVSPSDLTSNYSNMEGAMRLVSKRFWPIEHIVLMLFALFIANLGLVFSIQTPHSREKHRKVLIYYSIAIGMIAISLIAVNLP